MQKNLAKNSVFNILYKGCNVVYPMLVSVYISRIFKASGVGQISLAINIITYFTIAASLGLPNYAVKVLAGARDVKEQLNRRFSELAIIVACSSLGVSVLYYVSMLFYYGAGTDGYRIAMTLGLMLISNIFNYDWLYEAVESFEFLAIRTVAIKLTALVAMFLLVKSKDDLLIYCLIYSLVTVANNLANGLHAHKYVHFTKKDLHFAHHMKPVMVLFAAAFATELYTLLDSTMLGIMCPSEYLGYYSNASRVARAAYGVIFAATAVYNPRLGYIYTTGNREDYKTCFQQYYNQAMFLAVPAAAGLFLLAKQVVVVLFGTDFEPAGFTLRILSILIIVFTLATVFGHVPLVIYGKENVILVATIIGAVTNFSINSLLIPHYMNNGAAIASVVSEVLVTAILMYGSTRVMRIHILNNDIAAIALATGAMTIVIELLKQTLHSDLMCLLLCVIVGVLVYFIITTLMGNRLAKTILAYVRRILS